MAFVNSAKILVLFPQVKLMERGVTSIVRWQRAQTFTNVVSLVSEAGLFAHNNGRRSSSEGPAFIE